MRGSKAKRMRREFIEKYGTAPAKSVWTPQMGGGYAVSGSVWRLLKRLAKQGDWK